MAAAPGGVRLWFRLEGAASADRVVLPPGADVADLRDKIKEKLKPKLDHVAAVDLVLSTADGKTYDDEEASVPTVHHTKKEALIVTGTFVRVARSPFAAAYGPRSSCGGRNWKRSCRSGYWPAGGMFVRRGFRRRLAVFIVSGRAGRIMCGKCRSEFPPDLYENHRCPECKRLCARVLVALSVCSRSGRTGT
jgi:hypothetical protein